MWKWVLLAVIGIIIGVGVRQMANPPASPPLASSALLKPVDINQIRTFVSTHKVTLLNMWASWCEPCKAEFPALLELRSKYQKEGLQVVFLSADLPPDWPEAEFFLKTQKVDFLTYVAEGSPARIAAELNPQMQGAIPTSFLFQSGGKLIDSWQGERTLSELEAKIGPWLKAQ